MKKKLNIKQKKALIVAGASCWGNYRLQPRCDVLQ